LHGYLMLLMLALLAWTMRRAAGRLAPRVAIAPLVFLITRWPVLLAWLFGSAGMFLLLTTSAAANGKDLSAQWPMTVGLSVFCGLGAAALGVAPIWGLARAFASSPVLPLDSDETVSFELAANHFLGGEARGGKLLGTNRRLAFRPHRFNVQLATWSVPLVDLQGLRTEGSRFLLLTTKSASEDRTQEHWLVVQDPERVREQIERLAGMS
jgi:alkanesulfonate monooxygenase SsuD/methylene tetrahydromethanopterin reductase-like flavin-dependent oxidoreductase (luciferase family)